MDFCTYFNFAYLNRGLVCYETLMRYGAGVLYILCLDEITKTAVSKLNNVVIITLEDIEDYCPKLLTVKNKRSLKEYFATITPILPQFLFDKYKMDKLYYTDADISFVSSVNEIEEIMDKYSLMVSPHENPVAHAAAGYFNVGILGYRNDDNCLSFLKWWQEKCLEWCEWIALPDGRIADQGYLNILQKSNQFQNVLICGHPGVNLGPWNLALHKTEIINNKIVLDGKYNLICFHFHGYKNINGACANDTGWLVSPWNMEHIYHPYHELIKNK